MELEYANSRVYLVDDDPDVLDSLTVLIKLTGLKTVSFESAVDFLDSYCSEQPSCLVLDIQMPLMGGLELQQELSKRNINIPIIFISGNAEIPDAVKALKAGAVDFLEKPFEPNKLIEGILSAIRKDIKNREERIEKEKIKELFSSLSAREKEVLQLIISNHSSKQAAKQLDVSHRTIEAHRARIMEKMQAVSTTELVALAVKHTLI
ncbi:response regulator transcription factor [Methylomonas methanica]|uniref:DNA-binding response regulator n=1 Tax=Methylomonas methanica TaxID=421 RepID=A0A177MRM3_METMH|nr:response regulator [Methylomonas methanica]OAI08135.1 DNA-binding response regulator [Methylomonas methanica]